MPGSPLHRPILDWFAAHARTLPWREPDAGGWAVLVSEVMLQQTPVARVLPVYSAWMDRWPTSAALAREASGEAVRMWGRLGYPRRALRLHQAAVVIEADYDGAVPSSYDELLRLPGVGDYTAAAVSSFAFGHRELVLDTNVRRVLGRILRGQESPPQALTRAERVDAAQVLPDDPATAATWSVAVMELGALVCQARSPRCGACPVRDRCAWRLAGHPAYAGPPRRGQTYAGTDRQCRGRILAILRDLDEPLPRPDLEVVWADVAQRERALASLVHDGLVVVGDEGSLALP